MIGELPVEFGAVNETIACALPAAAVTPVGAPGTETAAGSKVAMTAPSPVEVAAPLVKVFEKLPEVEATWSAAAMQMRPPLR
jgi:hypothetical protein